MSSHLEDGVPEVVEAEAVCALLEVEWDAVA